MNRRVWVTGLGVAVIGGLAAFAQPEPKAKAPQPATGKFYPQYHITQSDDGLRVYLWGFDPETGETTAVASAERPEDVDDWGHRPGNFKDYFFAESEDGQRVYVWGYNPGGGVFRLVSTAGQARAGDPKENERLRREEEQRKRRERDPG